jgi:hypothetical protein
VEKPIAGGDAPTGAVDSEYHGTYLGIPRGLLQLAFVKIEESLKKDPFQADDRHLVIGYFFAPEKSLRQGPLGVLRRQAIEKHPSAAGQQ